MVTTDHCPKPFWQTLRFILSNLIVIAYYLGQIKPEMEMVNGILFAMNTVMIPMFVFIAAYLTQDIKTSDINRAILPAIITCTAFQLINTVPIIIRGEFSLLDFFIKPLDGVWFIIAVPLWQWFSKMHAQLRHHPVITMLIFLVIGFFAFYYWYPYSGLFEIVAYFPIFFLGRRMTHRMIQAWRATSVIYPLILFVSVVVVTTVGFHYLPESMAFTKLYTLPIELAAIYYGVILYLCGVLGMVIIYFIRYLSILDSVAPKALGVYLIHPIVCVIILYLLGRTGLVLDIPMALFLAVITIMISVGLAFIFPFNWLLAPKISHEEYGAA